MLRYEISKLKASIHGRPVGYVEFVFKHGKIDGDYVTIDDNVEKEIQNAFLPEKFEINQLKRQSKSLPPGFVDFIFRHGKIKGGNVELDLAALDSLHEKFPIPAISIPREPTIAEMSKNFTKAIVEWSKAGLPVVAKRVFDQRLKACNDCEYWDSAARMGAGKCNKCGCTVFKLWMETTQCPLTPPKW